MSQVFYLNHQIARDNAINAVRDAPLGYVVEVKQKTRSVPQNKILHAALTDISEQVIWNGQKLPVDVWKRLCIAAWLREKNENPLMIPAIDGKGIDIIYEKTSKLSTTQCSELVEWCFAFGVEKNVKFKR